MGTQREEDGKSQPGKGMDVKDFEDGKGRGGL